MVKALWFVIDALSAAGAVLGLVYCYDALTYPIMDICNAIGLLFGR